MPEVTQLVEGGAGNQTQATWRQRLWSLLLCSIAPHMPGTVLGAVDSVTTHPPQPCPRRVSGPVGGIQTPNQDTIVAKELVKEENLCPEEENAEKDTLRMRHLGRPL